MNNFLKLERFDIDPNSQLATKQWIHWFKTFNNFLSTFPTDVPVNKLALLTNFIAPSVYEFIHDVRDYNEAIKQLENIYEKPKSEIFARYLLSTRKQDVGENLDQYLHALRHLAKDCNFVDIKADIHRDNSIRDTFLTGLSSSYSRQRLLENKTLTLQTAYDQAKALESAQKQAESYIQGNSVVAHTKSTENTSMSDSKCEQSSNLAAFNDNHTNNNINQKCYF